MVYLARHLGTGSVVVYVCEQVIHSVLFTVGPPNWTHGHGYNYVACKLEAMDQQ